MSWDHNLSSMEAAHKASLCACICHIVVDTCWTMTNDKHAQPAFSTDSGTLLDTATTGTRLHAHAHIHVRKLHVYMLLPYRCKPVYKASAKQASQMVLGSTW